MKRLTQETERHSPLETTRGFLYEKRALLFYFSMIAISLVILSTTAAQFIWSTYFKEVEAITMPFGIIYLKENPEPWLVDHEQCHLDRIEDIGAIPFYADYLFGGACIEELRCGSTLRHPACSEYPLSNIPTENRR